MRDQWLLIARIRLKSWMTIPSSVASANSRYFSSGPYAPRSLIGSLPSGARRAPAWPVAPSIFQDQPGQDKHDHHCEDDREHHVAEEVRTASHTHQPDDGGK